MLLKSIYASKPVLLEEKAVSINVLQESTGSKQPTHQYVW